MLGDQQAQLARHLERLCVDIGPRPSGSAACRAAGEYIRDVFRAAGLEVEEQKYECPDWEHEETYLALNGGQVEAAANAFSPPCDVSAPGVAVGTVAELEMAELEGRIGILYGDLTKSPLSPKSWFLKSDREDHIIRLLERKRPAALVTVQARLGALERVMCDWEFLIPSATVPGQVGLALLAESEPWLHLRIKSHQAPGWSCNVVGRKGGSKPERVVLCAHYDTTIDTPGALDNGGGAAILMALAGRLGQEDQALGLEWIAFSGHEYLPLGDDEYLRLCGDQLDQIVACINFDGAGQWVSANSLTIMASSQAFHDQVTELTQGYPGLVWVEPWPQSNHSTFAMRGVPSLAFSSVGRVYLDHLRADSVEWVSPAKLEEVVGLVMDILSCLQDKSLDWTREKEAG